MLYWEIIAVCSETRTKKVQVLWDYFHKVPLLQYGHDDPVFGSRHGKKLSLLQNTKTGSGTKTGSFQWITVFFPPRVNRPGREVNHSSLLV
jgi:hypothetical protein